ncbi:MAG: hypothetical protein V4487_03040 [Chlamydiota bacterium]
MISDIKTGTIHFDPHQTQHPLDPYLGNYSREMNRTVTLIVQGEDLYSNPNRSSIIVLAAKAFASNYRLKDLPLVADSHYSINNSTSIDELLNITPADLTEHLNFALRFDQILNATGLSVTIETAPVDGRVQG